MANPYYSVVKEQINKLKYKVMLDIQRFQPKDLNINNLLKYPNNLKDITNLQDKLDDLIYDVLFVLLGFFEESKTQRSPKLSPDSCLRLYSSYRSQSSRDYSVSDHIDDVQMG